MATGRRTRGVILIRMLVTVWLLGLTAVLVAVGYGWWALLTFAGAVANTVLAYRISQARTR